MTQATKTHNVSVNDIPLLASSPVQWALKSGVRPVIMEYDISPNFFERFIGSLSQSKDVTLAIKTDKDAEIKVKNLYYLGNAVGPNPFIKRIILADRRWLWNRKAIYRRYNIRRHIGTPGHPPPGKGQGCACPRSWRV